MTTPVEFRTKLCGLQEKLTGDLHYKKRSRLEADFQHNLQQYNRLVPRDTKYREWYRKYHTHMQQREKGFYGPP